MRTHPLVLATVLFLSLSASACGGGFPEPWSDWGFPTEGFDGPPTGDARLLQAGYIVPGTSTDAVIDQERRFDRAAPAVVRLADAYRARITSRSFEQRCDRGSTPGKRPGYQGTFDGADGFIYLSVSFNEGAHAKSDGRVLVTLSTDPGAAPRACQGSAR
jgi:hypothetical protein